jgi:Polysaccharide pyruvyl transferase
MLAVTYAHESTNFRDQAITIGTVALLNASSDEETVVLRVGDPVPDGATVVYGGGEHLFSGPRLATYAGPISRAERGVVLPSTFGPFDAQDEDTFRAVARHPIAARDHVSASIAEGLVGRAVPVLLDPAFFLDVPTGNAGSFTIWAPRREDVGLRLDTLRSEVPVRQTTAFATYRDLIGGDGLIVAHVRSDIALCRALSRVTGVPWVRPETLDEILELYRDCGRVVTSRFHAIVFARLFDKPYEAIPWPAHGHKIVGLPDIDDLPAWRERTVAWAHGALAAEA